MRQTKEYFYSYFFYIRLSKWTPLLTLCFIFYFRNVLILILRALEYNLMSL
uniref:Uncharacterized protein n=1 Tax=Rhizophora mucronata TaxID=61149 RepID=A0A2P2N7E8_RHIMU